MRSSRACSAVPLCVASGATEGPTTIDSPAWLSRIVSQSGTSRCWSRANRRLRSRSLTSPTRGGVRDAPDRRVVGAPLEAAAAEGRVPLGDADAEVEGIAATTPALGELGDARAHRERHADRALRRVRAVERVVEDDHEPVAGE